MNSQPAKPSEEQIAISGVYARALLSLAVEQKLADRVQEELDGLLSVLDSQPALDGYFVSPGVDSGQRGEMIDRLFKGSLSDVVVDTLQVMNRKGRLGLVRALALTYGREYRDSQGIIEVHARTAVAMGEELRAKLQRAVSQYSGKEAHLVEQVDESLLGGMVLSLDDQKIDSSVAREIKDLGRRLGERASQEVRFSTAMSDNE